MTDANPHNMVDTCGNCGADVAIDDIVCRSCGATLAAYRIPDGARDSQPVTVVPAPIETISPNAPMLRMPDRFPPPASEDRTAEAVHQSAAATISPDLPDDMTPIAADPQVVESTPTSSVDDRHARLIPPTDIPGTESDPIRLPIHTQPIPLQEVQSAAAATPEDIDREQLPPAAKQHRVFASRLVKHLRSWMPVFIVAGVFLLIAARVSFEKGVTSLILGIVVVIWLLRVAGNTGRKTSYMHQDKRWDKKNRHTMR